MSLNPLSFPPLPSQDPSRESSSSPDHITVSDTASTISEEDDLAEQEWQESLAQLTLLFNLVILPFAGKYFGRKFAYFIWARFMEWRYPVQILVTSKKTFEIAGVAEAALT